MSSQKYPMYSHKNISNQYDDSKLIKKDTISLADGRPVLCELWEEYEYTFISYYFSALDLKDFSKKELIEYLEDNGINDLSNSSTFTTDDISFENRKDQENEFLVMTISIEN